MQTRNLHWLAAVLVLGGMALVAVAGVAQGAGAAGALLTADWVFDGDESGDQVGYAVGTAGDVNNDGLADVIIGAPKDTPEDSSETLGRAYLFYGTYTGLEALPDWQAAGEVHGSLFGGAVGTAGNVNGDAFDDIIVGASDYKTGVDKEGKPGAVYVFYGSGAGPSLAPDWSCVGDQKDAALGYAVGTAGDVNGDGWDDIIVGARWYSNTLTSEGAAYVFYGSPSGLSDCASPDWVAYGGQAGAGFGSAVGTAGDVNGDGWADVAVGAPFYDGSYPDAGAVFVYYGSGSGLSASPDWFYAGDQAGAGVGGAVAAAGDVNNDNRDDLIAGARWYSATLDNEGAAFVFHGSVAGLSASPNWMATGKQLGAGFGHSVGAAGDVDGDGYDDVIVGAPRYGVAGSDEDQPEEGIAVVYHGGPTGLRQRIGWRGEGDKAGALFGWSAATAGDVNKDGYADLVVGAPEYRRLDKTLIGRAFGFYGPMQAPEFSVSLPLVQKNSDP